MPKVIVVGGGWAGCSAAVRASKAGAQVTLLERTDSLLGTGLVGGIMRNNGRFTAAEEAISMGAKELFTLTDQCARHTQVDFPGHKHASLYNIYLVEPAVRKLLAELAVEVRTESLVKETLKEGDVLRGVVTKNGEIIEGDVFIDTTGTGGGMNNCSKYGRGCCMCVIRCPAFGGRISLAEISGVQEFTAAQGASPFAAMSGSCKLAKDSLSAEIVEKLDRDGVVVIPLKQRNIDEAVLKKKACQQYALPQFKENLIILDTGAAKIMTPFFPLESLRQLEGFSQARFLDPYAGGKGNSMRFIVATPRDNTLKVQGVKNLFCAGEKVGLMVGHTEAIVTGALAGFNAVSLAAGKNLLAIPRSLASGDIIAFIEEQLKEEKGFSFKYTFSGSVYWERMQKLNLYTTDLQAIAQRVEQESLTGIYQEKIV